MRITSYSNSSVTIAGTEPEMAALQKMVAGLGYVACGREGMPLFAEKFLNVEPIPDPQLMQHFTPAPASVAKFTAEKPIVSLPESESDSTLCSIYVEALCGYDYSPEYYARAAQKMTEFGFVCMRSPRGQDGRYWEAWFLPGIFAAKGSLQHCKTVEGLINELLRYVRPGSISAVQQRVALSIT